MNRIETEPLSDYAGQLAMEVQLFFKYERNQVFSEGLGRYNDVLAMAVLFEVSCCVSKCSEYSHSSVAFAGQRQCSR